MAVKPANLHFCKHIICQCCVLAKLHCARYISVTETASSKTNVEETKSTEASVPDYKLPFILNVSSVNLTKTASSRKSNSKEDFLHKLNVANAKDFWKAIRKMNSKQ